MLNSAVPGQGEELDTDISILHYLEVKVSEAGSGCMLTRK